MKRIRTRHKNPYPPQQVWAVLADFKGLQNGAQGRNRTTDTVIFSHVLYQLSYLGPILRATPPGRRPAEARRSLTFVLFAVQLLGIRRGPGNPIAFAEPFQQVAVLAATRAERRVRLGCGLAAQWARLGFRRARHRRPTWGQKGRRAS